jgi:2-dehydro-3-deoxygalactonokinase
MGGKPALFALDWGTSNLRAYLLGDGGAILDHANWPLGIMQVKDGDFAGALGQVLSAWPAAEGLPLIASGMIGSRQGWREVPYAACPAGLSDVARGMARLDWRGRRLSLVPGVSCLDRHGIPDVMRGEETQIFGAAADRNDRGLFVLPGTHSKWALVEKGRIIGFATFMTGETFAALKDHTILGRTMQGGGIDAAAFRRGVEAARAAGGALLHGLFGVRSLGLFGKLAQSEGAGYLSGLLIGSELLEAPRLLGLGEPPAAAVLIGEPALTKHYRMAAEMLGRSVEGASADAAAMGLWRLAGAAGLAKEAA